MKILNIETFIKSLPLMWIVTGTLLAALALIVYFYLDRLIAPSLARLKKGRWVPKFPAAFITERKGHMITCLSFFPANKFTGTPSEIRKIKISVGAPYVFPNNVYLLRKNILDDLPGNNSVPVEIEKEIRDLKTKADEFISQIEKPISFEVFVIAPDKLVANRAFKEQLVNDRKAQLASLSLKNEYLLSIEESRKRIQQQKEEKEISLQPS